MSWLWIILILAGAAAAGLLLPRLRFQAEFAPGHLQLSIDWFWFGVRCDLRSETCFVRVLFWTVKEVPTTSSEKEKQAGEPEPTRPPKPSPSPKDSRSRRKEVERIEAGPKRRRKREKEQRKRKKESIKRRFRIEDAWAERTLILLLARRVMCLALDVLKSVHIDWLHCHLVLATDDPALTGMLFGAMQPFLPILPHKANLLVETDFDGDSPRADFSGSVSFRPAYVLILSLWSVLRLPWWRMWRTYRRYRAPAAA